MGLGQGLKLARVRLRVSARVGVWVRRSGGWADLDLTVET